MGILSPQAYDQLFLEKCKLLLQAACNNPRRRGPDVSYEEFVESLDIRDEGSLRVFEVLLYETSTRRPPKRQPRSQAASSTERTGSTLQRRPRISTAGRLSQALQDLEPDDSYSHSRDRQVSRSRMQDLRLPSDSDDSSDAEHQAAVRSRRERLRNHRTPAEGANGTDDGISPSMRLRQQQLNDLFGRSPEPSTILQDLLQTPSSIGSLDARSSSRPNASASSFSSSAPLLPTFAELWSILTDEPFPSSSITSYSSFLDALNRCASVTSATSTPLTAPGMGELLEELAQRDLAFPIRLTNLLQQRESARSRADGEIGAGSGGSGGHWAAVMASVGVEDASTTEATHARLLEGEARGDTSSFLEGIWRAGFIEHIDDGGVPAGTDEGGDEASAATFADFTGRRRAERRRRDEAGGTSSPAGSSSTPAITVTDASSAPTPATTAAHSPPSSSAAADCPPARQTSASIAEAAFRSQRLIAPLPSTSSSTPRAVSQDQAHEREEMSEGQASLQAVFEALQRARERREEHGVPPNEVMM